MKNEEIIKLEYSRTKENLNTVYMFKDGDWYHAYEYSAYMCYNFPTKLKNEEKLKVTRKKSPDCENGIVFLGFKLSSIDKFLPNCKNLINAEKDGIIEIKMPMIFFEDKMDYKKQLNDWKDTIEIKESSKNGTTKQVESASVKAIIQKIIGYPIESKSLIDNVRFLSELKIDLIKVL